MKKLISASRGGLGNRVNSVCAIVAACHYTQENPAIFWPINQDCGASFEDIFQPLDNVEMVNSSRGRSISIPSLFPHRQGRLLRALQMPGVPGSFLKQFRKVAQSLEPSVPVQKLIDTIDDKSIVTVHVRWNDLIRRRYDESELTALSSAMNYKADHVFLCCDNPEIKDYILKEILPGAIALDAPLATTDKGERGKEAVQYAAAEMFLMASSQALFTAGGRSTLRSLATVGYQVPTFDLNPGTTDPK